MDRPRRELVIPEEIPLDIVYEDEDLMVINKPPGMVASRLRVYRYTGQSHTI